jgi:hypothetical protein
MKSYITLRSTLSNVSWAQLGAAALVLMAALVFALTLALRPSTHVPAPPSTVRQAAPASISPNLPVFGTGSAYDGGHAATPRTPRRAASALPVFGTGSAYDGRAYLAEQPSVRSPNTPAIGTGSAYDGQ